MALLDDTDVSRIEAAVARVEQKTAAEIVVAVVPRSARHDFGRGLVSAASAVAAAILYFRFLPWGSEAVGLFLQLPVFGVVWFALGVPALHRVLIPAHEAEDSAHGAALRLFSERGVHRTRHRTGLLLFVSELERRAVILGDVGIQERFGEAGFVDCVTRLTSRLAEGRAADGILETLAGIEERLAASVPIEPRDENELPNQVILKP